MKTKEKLLRLRKPKFEGSTIWVLYKTAKETQDPKLIREVNKIIRGRKIVMGLGCSKKKNEVK